MTATDLDPTRIEEFAGRMVGLVNDALLSLSISIGHQTGLFDTMAELPPSTSGEIAKAADLHERYVREVLGALTTGGIVTYDADARARTRSPPSTPRVLTRAAGVDNLAALTQFVGMLGAVEQDVVALLPRRRRRAVLELPDLPPADGRADEGDRRRDAARRHARPRAGPRATAGGGHRRRRHRLRLRLRDERPRRARSRTAASPASTSPRRRSPPPAAQAAEWALDQRDLRGPRRHRPRDHRRASTSSRRSTRSTTRPPRRRVLRGIADALRARRRVPLRRHRGVEPPRGQHRAPAGAGDLHDLHDALHDRVARARRRRPRRRVGRADRAADARRRRLRRRRRPSASRATSFNVYYVARKA